jgi:hypothetical protein
LPQGQARPAAVFGFAMIFFACLARLMFHRGMNAPFKMAPDLHNAFQGAIVGVHDWNVNLVAPDLKRQ